MSDRERDEVRALAEEIAINCYPVGGSTQEKLINFAEDKVRAFLADRDSYLPRVAPEAHSAAVYRAEQREAALQAQLHRALGEGARLRGAVKGIAGRHRQNHIMQFGGCKTCGLIDSALAASPLSERAGAVIGAVIGLLESPGENPSRVLLEGQRLRAELAKGGEGG